MGGWCEGPALSVNRICYDETTGPEMRIADFLVMLLPSKRGIGVTKKSRMNALFKDLTFQIGLFVEVNPLKTPWETICHLDLWGSERHVEEVAADRWRLQARTLRSCQKLTRQGR